MSSLVAAWDDGEADAIAAVNLFLDRSRDRRRAEFERLRAEVGQCQPPDGFRRVENPLRGDWLLTCEKGQLLASVTLAPTMPPTMPPLVQHMDVRPVPSGGESLRRPCP